MLSSSFIPMHGQGRPSFPLLAIVFAEFDNTVGPKITCQAPEGFLSDEIFDSISDFIITGQELVHKLVTVTTADYQIIGYPMQLSHKKYHRNALLFNVAFVFPRDVNSMNRDENGNSDEKKTVYGKLEQGFTTAASLQSTATQLRPYHPVIRKLATIIESLELESEFLFRPESKRALQGVVSKIFRSLNTYGECSVLVETVREVTTHAMQSAMQSASTGGGSSNSSIQHHSLNPAISSPDAVGHNHNHANGTPAPTSDLANKINLKLYPLLALPPKVIPSYAVPLRIKDLDERWKQEWDLTLREIIPFIDGVNYVSRISTLSGIHASLVAKCIRQLMYYSAVVLIDLFQFTNIYVTGDKLHTFLPNVCSSRSRKDDDKDDKPLTLAEEEDRIRWFRFRASCRSTCRLDLSKPKPKFSLLFRLYAAMDGKRSIGDLFRSMHQLVGTYKDSNGATLTLENSNIHPRKFVQFGVINGLIRRVHAYPVLVSNYHHLSMNSASSNASQAWAQMILGEKQHTGSDSKSGNDGSSGASTSGSNSGNTASASISSPALAPVVPIAPSWGYNFVSSNSVDWLFYGLIHAARNPVEEFLARHAQNQLTQAANGGGLGGRSVSSNSLGRMKRSHSKVFNALPNQSATERAATAAAKQASTDESDSNAAPSIGISPPTPVATPSIVSFRALEKYLDGEHHFDQLCCIFQKSFAQLEEEIKKSKKCIIIYK